MALSFAQLSTPLTLAQALEEYRKLLAEQGFSSTAWLSGSVQLTILYIGADLTRRATEWVQSAVLMVFNETATGEGLTRFSASVYDNTRIAATKTIGLIELTVASGSGPYTVAIGDLVVTNGTHTYRNITGDTLTSAAPVSLSFEAEIAGNATAVANNTITTMITTLAGVTCNNPGVGVSNTWITTTGNNEESDATLRERNRTKWPSLSIEKPSDAYVNIIREVTSLANFRVLVDDTNPDGPGTVNIYIASDTGAAGAGDVTAAQTQIDQFRAVTADVDVIAAPAEAITFGGTIYFPTAFNTAPNQTTINAAMKAYIDSLPIGGIDLASGGANVVPIDGVEAAARSAIVALGVSPTQIDIDLTLNGAAADVTLTAFNVATFGTAGHAFVSI